MKKTTVRDLNPAPYNPRTIAPGRLDQLGRAMRKFGDLGGVVFNVRTRHLVGGHQRIKHLDPDWEVDKVPCRDKQGTVALGRIVAPSGETWAYREVDWDEATEKAANVAANAAGGAFDDSMLRGLIAGVEAAGIDAQLLNLENIDSIMGRAGPAGEAPDQEPPGAEPGPRVRRRTRSRRGASRARG